MLILYFIMITLFYGWAILSHKNSMRIKITLIATILVIFFILLAQYNLSLLGISFNLSDSHNYYYNNALIKGSIDGSNGSNGSYYSYINWLMKETGFSDNTSSILLKVSNVGVFFAGYLIAFNNRRFNKIELLILFHPYFIITAIRNVRDLQVIAFLFMSMGAYYYQSRIKAIVPLCGLLLLRPFMAFELIVSKYLTKKILICLFVLFTILLFTNSYIYFTVLYPIVAAYGIYNDFNETYNIYLNSLMSFDISPSFIFTLFKLFLVGIIKFVFTPILPSYFNKFLHSDSDFFSIYTSFDMYLIFFGVLVNVLFVIPMFLSYGHSIFVNRRDILKKEWCLCVFLCSIIFSYAYFHLGGTDIRIRFAFISTLIYCIFNFDKFYFDKRYVLLSVVILLLLPVLNVIFNELYI